MQAIASTPQDGNEPSVRQDLSPHSEHRSSVLVRDKADLLTTHTVDYRMRVALLRKRRSLLADCYLTVKLL